MTGQDLGEATTAESIAAALADSQPSWITLPSRDEELPSGLRLALDDFDAGERAAARAAGTWLQTQAVAAHQTSRTRLLIASGRVVGFYSLASAQVELSSTIAGGPVSYLYECPQPSSPGSPRTGERRSTASCCCSTRLLLPAELQATSVLVVDPFDEETAAMWRERYGFRPSAEARKPKRLWLPLQTVG